MAELTERILEYLEKNNAVDSLLLSTRFNEDHQKIVGAIKSLQALGNIISSEQRNSKYWQLTEEGKQVAEKGSHEALVFYAIPKNGILQSELMKTIPSSKIGFSKAIAAGWIYTDKSNEDGPIVKRKVSSIEDVVQQSLKKMLTNEDDDISDAQKQEYKKRKLLQEITLKSYFISKGSEFSTSFSKQETDLTSEMIARQSWKEKKFKPYNFNALGVNPVCGYFHPLMKVRSEFRQIFLEMGFTEMPTNNFIESSFWNFDALFQPQQHPARDAHDTFFISDPKYATEFPEKYLQKVKTVHERGGFGSQGYKYEWKLEDAKKNLLRTHTTAVSARMLYHVAQQEKFKPVKYFSIDRVFRNETLDATHLAEFHQIEGVIADYNLTLGHLIGVLYEFFKKLGITKLRFKPTYNPYTEPSMEIFSYHEGFQKWVEIGNSGMFRPEMLLPMGLPKEVHVVAWGLSLERPTMIKYGYNNIRDLVGQKVNLLMVQENALCRLDKNSSYSSDDNRLQNRLINLEIRQDRILNKLETIGMEVEIFEKENFFNNFNGVNVVNEMHLSLPNNLVCSKEQKHQDNSAKANYVAALHNESRFVSKEDSFPDVLIYCNPKQPMWSILAIHQTLSEFMPIEVVTEKDQHMHSLDSYLEDFFNVNRVMPLNLPPQLKLHFIWKEIGNNSFMMIDKTSIFGEVNIIRYFGRLVSPKYDEDPVLSTIIDDWLDRIHVTVLNGNNKDRAALLRSVNEHLKTNTWLVNSEYSIADLAMWSALCQTQAIETTLTAVNNWLKACSLIPSVSAASTLIDKYY